MTTGIERAPVSPRGLEGEATGRYRDSVLALHELLKYDVWIESYLGIHSDAPFIAGPEELAARHALRERAHAASHVRHRGIHQIGELVVGTVSQFRAEFSGQRTLDIGCGNGQLGVELARKAGAKVTFLDNDTDIVKSIVPRAGKRIAGDGTSLPFRDEVFARTIASFSSITWAETPLETVQALHEALRVTSSDGSLLAAAIMANITNRKIQSSFVAANKNGAKPRVIEPGEEVEDEGALKVWALQDHVLMHALWGLIDGGYCAVTWSGYIGLGQNTSATIEIYSAIIDKHKPIPESLVQRNLSYAASFMK